MDSTRNFVIFLVACVVVGAAVVCGLWHYGPFGSDPAGPFDPDVPAESE